MRNRLCNKEELLYRQIRKREMNQGLPSSQAFRPEPKDDDRLSLDRSALTTTQKSFERFLDKGYDTVAVFGLTVGEFKGVGVLCYSDPTPCNEAHVFANFSGFNGSQQKKKARRLKEIAIDRGQLFPSAAPLE